MSFIESHQVLANMPATPAMISRHNKPCSSTVSTSTKDWNPPAPVSSSASSGPPLLHQSSRVSQPTKKQAATTGEQFVPMIQHAMVAALAMPGSDLPSSMGPQPPTHNIADDEFILTSPALGHEEEDSWFAGAATTKTPGVPANPATYQEAMASLYVANWTRMLHEEFNSLKELGVYHLVPHSSVPAGHCIMCGQPIFKVKQDENGNPMCFKACYVCRGYTTIYGQDYMKTMFPMACMEFFHILAHLVSYTIHLTKPSPTLLQCYSHEL